MFDWDSSCSLTLVRAEAKEGGNGRERFSVMGQDLFVELLQGLWLVEEGIFENDARISSKIPSVRSLYSWSWRRRFGPESREARPLKRSKSSRNVTGSDSIGVKDSALVLLLSGLTKSAREVYIVCESYVSRSPRPYRSSGRNLSKAKVTSDRVVTQSLIKLNKSCRCSDVWQRIPELWCRYLWMTLIAADARESRPWRNSFYSRSDKSVSMMLFTCRQGRSFPHQLDDSSELPIISELLELLNRRIHNPQCA